MIMNKIDLISWLTHTVLPNNKILYVRAVTFVGSSPVASAVSNRCYSLNKRCTALGGKNSLVYFYIFFSDVSNLHILCWFFCFWSFRGQESFSCTSRLWHKWNLKRCCCIVCWMRRFVFALFVYFYVSIGSYMIFKIKCTTTIF